MKTIKLISMTILFLRSDLAAYSPPIGIPNPLSQFGKFDPIDTSRPDTRNHCPGWHATPPRDNTRAAGDSRDSYYVNNNDPNATDTSNTYGRPNRPRKTIPDKVFLAGDYIEVYGTGSTAPLTSSYSGILNPRGVGTDTEPIWIVGINYPVFTGNLSMGRADFPRACYIVYDGLNWRNGASVELRPRYENNLIDHVTFRNCTMIGAAKETDPLGFLLTANSLASNTQKVHDIVIHNCEIGHYGDPGNPYEECCISIGTHVQRFWCLDSNIHHAAEDGILMSHMGKRTSKNIFIGRNNIHENTTNALDLKGIGGPVVISQNHMWGHQDVWIPLSGGNLVKNKNYMWTDVSGNPDFSNIGVNPPYVVGKMFSPTGITPNSWGTASVLRQLSSGIGETCVFHYAGSSGGPDSFRNYPEDISFLFNYVEGGRMGLATSSCGQLRIIGNIFQKSRRLPGPYITPSHALDIRGIKGDIWISHNTIHDCEGGIRIWDMPQAYNSGTTYYAGYTSTYNNSTFVCIDENGGIGSIGNAPSDPKYWRPIRVRIFGNIISNTYNQKEDILINGSTFFSNSVDAGSNCIYRPGAISLVGYQIPSSDITSNPLLSDPAQENFSLGAGSPCIDTSVEGIASAYDDFLALTGIDIHRDRSGGIRPLGKAWDMGAHEHGHAISGPQPGIPPPKNVRVSPRKSN